jgi:hypothetical protein
MSREGPVKLESSKILIFVVMSVAIYTVVLKSIKRKMDLTILGDRGGM